MMSTAVDRTPAQLASRLEALSGPSTGSHVDTTSPLAEPETEAATPMEHVRIAIYDITSGSLEEVASRAEAELLPIFRAHPGFVSYGMARMNDFKILSLSVWESHDQAEEADRRAADWVLETLGDRVHLTDSQVGEFLFLDFALPEPDADAVPS
jgi:hypothetical protein